MDLLDFIGYIGLGVLLLVGSWLLFMFSMVRMLHTQQKLERELAKASQNSTMKLVVETAGDQFLCYNSATMDFVCQGTSLEEIKTRFRQRYPNRAASVIGGDEQAVTALKQQLKHQTTI